MSYRQYNPITRDFSISTFACQRRDGNYSVGSRWRLIIDRLQCQPAGLYTVREPRPLGLIDFLSTQCVRSATITPQTQAIDGIASHYYTTCEAACVLVVSVCLSTITFESLDVGTSFLHLRHIRTTGQVRIWRSSGQSQGHRSKKGQNPYSHNVKLRLTITPVL